MKILIVHNEYGKPSGEEAVVAKMHQIFQSLGHSTASLTMTTAGSRESLSGKIRTFAAGIHSPAGIRAMARTLDREKPDLVNVHNLYPFISPAALQECRKRDIPVVMTVHNFRLVCPTGLFMRNDAPCEICLQRGNEWACIRHNCEHSLPKSLAYAARNALARIRRHYLDCVTTFACITQFQRQKLIQARIPKEKLTIIPNSIDIPQASALDTRHSTLDTKTAYVGFVGRLSQEKGIDLIIEAALQNPDIPFRLAGAVADPELVADLPPNVELAGFLSGEALANFYADARFILMASRCYEGFPMAILEAAAQSRPTIGPDHGGFTKILTLKTQQPPNSLLFTPASLPSLSAKIRQLWDNPALCDSLGLAMHQKLLAQYSTQAVTKKWQALLNSIHNPSEFASS